MTADTRSPVPGQFLLRQARAFFSESAITTIIEPAIADAQREVTTARSGRARLGALLRGYASVWMVIVLAAFVPGAGAGAPGLAGLAGRNGGFLISVLGPLLLAALWPTFGAFTAGAVVVGMAFSFVVRAWNRGHPSASIGTRQHDAKGPEINVSGIPVAGDIGGFFFVVASIVVMLGVPALRGFLAGAILAGVTLATALFAWRRHHLTSPVRRIIVS